MTYNVSQQSQGIVDSTWCNNSCRSNQKQAISIHLIRKSFLPFKLYTAYLEEKSSHQKSHTFPNWFTVFLLLTVEMLSPVALVTVGTSVSLQKIWLLLLVNTSSKFSTINDYFKIPTCFIDGTTFKSSKFPMSSISLSSSSSSSITTFREPKSKWSNLIMKLQYKQE